MEHWRERMRAHEEAAYLHLWADAARAHLHALPFVPARVARERERFSAYRDRTQGRNLQADLLQAEVRGRARVVSVGPAAVAVCPFAPAAPSTCSCSRAPSAPTSRTTGPPAPTRCTTSCSA